MSSSQSMSRRLTEKAGGGMRLTLILRGLSERGCLGQWLVNVGAIDSLSSGSLQAGANETAVVVEADVLCIGWT
jgi:hypothetical protein